MLKELKSKPFADMAQEACQQEQNMVVMCIGDANNPFIFLETPDLDVAELWDLWCEHYCKATQPRGELARDQRRELTPVRPPKSS